MAKPILSDELWAAIEPQLPVHTPSPIRGAARGLGLDRQAQKASDQAARRQGLRLSLSQEVAASAGHLTKHSQTW